MRRFGVLVWSFIAVIAILGALGPASGYGADGSHTGSPVAFDIAPQPLTDALIAFSAHTHLQVLYEGPITEGIQSSGVSGEMMPMVALDRLLAGTGLSYRLAEGDTITLVRDSSSGIVPGMVGAGVAAGAMAVSDGSDEAVQPTQKPVKVPEILVKDVRQRGADTSYVAEETNTATKSDVPLLETPQSITVITRARMQSQEVNTLAEALRYAAGVQGEPAGFEPRLTWLRLRGFESSTDGIFKDGLQLRNPAFGTTYNLEPYGAEQLDVLRGPASFLYGQGSPGGLLNFITKRPTKESLHEAQFLVGNYGRYEGRFDLGGKINDNDKLLFRVTGLFRESGTQIDNVPYDRIFIAPALTWQMASRTSLTLLATYQKDNVNALQWLPSDGTLLPNPNGVVTPRRFAGQPGVDHYRRTEFHIGYEFRHEFSDSWNFLQKVRYNENNLDQTTTYIYAMDPDRRTGLRDEWADVGKLGGLAMDNQLHGRFSTGSLHHAFLGGLDFQRVTFALKRQFAEASSIDVFNRYDYGLPGVVPYFNSNQEITQYQTGLYVQDQVKYDQWLLTIGGRHDWAKNETTDLLANTSQSQTDNKFTGRAALTYVFKSGIAPYVSYSTFFLPSIGTDPEGQPFKPETGRQYEAGIKYQIPNTRAFLTAAVFDLTRENYVQTDPGTFLPVQRGKARSRGVELEGAASFDSGIDVIAAYTILNTRIIQTTEPTEQDKMFIQTPAQFGSLWVKYTVPEGTMKGLGIGGGARYTGYTYGDAANNFKVPSYVLGDAVADYLWGHWRFALNISNIFNRHTFACFNEGQTCTYNELRQVVGTVAYRW
ncbi:TonB-dependent siderophore receptor [Nitrospira sp. KM1]|uniref:TonB-dependent siderophore receptor n=1 Tax=Nitrospira sp. KM1 TaxID=1936990 RepID=UPI0013A763EA|nr:TonB-dependent siderophore receptor [Nitrospira sp. KM1]BCA56626.1 TonB-dependent siderophore receptor [Nitrospira sp. KM1]